jgi:3-oxoacyl-[acyl-carrier-protein] synthase-1
VSIVAGYGITTALGADTRQSCAAMRAGLARFGESDLHMCRGLDPEQEDLEPVLVARVSIIDPSLEGALRLRALLIPALRDAVKDARIDRHDLMAARSYLVVPPSQRPGAPAIDEDWLADLYRSTGVAAPAPPQIFRSGHSGFGEAIQAALTGLTEEPHRIALVLSVDSLLCNPTLAWLDGMDRLKCSRSPEGIVAGEGAAVLILRAAPGVDAPVRARIGGVGLAQEQNTILTPDRPCIGTGLGDAVRAASASSQGVDTGEWAVVDHTGERYAALEWGYVLSRLHGVFGRLRHTWYVGDCLGDTGAAAGGLAAARVLAAWQWSYAPAQRAWLIAGSDEGGRSVVVLDAEPLADTAAHTGSEGA